MKMCQIWLRLNYSSRDKGAATNHTIHSDRFLSETECSLGFRARLVVILKNPSQELPWQFTFLSKWQQNTPLPFRTFTFNRNFIFPAGTMIVSTISVCKQFLELCTCGARVERLFLFRIMLSPTNCCVKSKS